MSAFGPKRTLHLAPHMSAFGGKADMTVCRCLLSRSQLGIKRTWPFALHMSAFDPKRTCETLSSQSISLTLPPRLSPKILHPSKGLQPTNHWQGLTSETFTKSICQSARRNADGCNYRIGHLAVGVFRSVSISAA